MADRRVLILQAAERLLGHYGLQKTTVADIAREAKIGVGTVYLEFNSKDAIISELSDAKYRHVLRAMRRAAFREGDFSTRLAAMMGARVDAFLQLAAVGAHAAELVHGGCSAVSQAQRVFERAQLDLLTDFLHEAGEAGDFQVPDEARAAEALLAAYSSFEPPAIFRFTPPEARSLLAQMHTLMLNGLRARS